MTTPRSSEHAITCVLACRRGLVFVSLFPRLFVRCVQGARQRPWATRMNELLSEQLALLLWVCLLCALCFAVVSLSFSTRLCCFDSLATAAFVMCVSCANLIYHLKIGVYLYIRFLLRGLLFVFDYAYGYTPLSRFLFSCHCVAFLDGSTFAALALAVVQRVVACHAVTRFNVSVVLVYFRVVAYRVCVLLFYLPLVSQPSLKAELLAFGDA